MSFVSGEELGHAHPTPTLPSDCDFSREDIALKWPCKAPAPRGRSAGRPHSAGSSAR